MAIETFANIAQTTLNNGGTLTAGATSCTVTSGAAFPSTGQFRIVIDSEIILVTANAANVFTLVRGQEGTTGASHADGSTVTHVLTAAVMKVLQLQFPITQTNAGTNPYAMDSSGPPSDALILHNRSGHTTYIMPAPTKGRRIVIKDITGTLETGNTNGYITGSATTANTVFVAPNGVEKFNTSSGFAMTGTVSTLTTTALVGSGTKFLTELAPGMTVVFSSQNTVSYIIDAIADNTHATLHTSYSGSSAVGATMTMNALAYYANFGELTLYSDGTDWFASSNKPLRVKLTGNGTFIASPGCTSCSAIGCGGGGGGGGGGSNATQRAGGGGGGGALESNQNVTLTPNTSVVTTIGVGGSAGGGGTGAAGGVGGAGGNTTFGSLATWGGASGGSGGSVTASQQTGGGIAVISGPDVVSGDLFNNVATTGVAGNTTLGRVSNIAGGGSTDTSGTAANQLDGFANPIGGFSPGTGGSGNATIASGGGGGAGPRGAGGNAGASGTTGSGGSGPSANTGAGAGGGGGATVAANAGGNGGQGGSGYLDLVIPM